MNQTLDVVIEIIDDAQHAERRLIIGLILAEYAKHKLAGRLEVADALDSLATQIEHL